MDKKQPPHKVLYRTIKYGIKNVPGYLCLLLLISLLVAIINFLSLIGLQYIFDSATESIATGIWNTTYLALFLLTGILVLSSFISGYHGHITWHYFMKFMNKILKVNNAKAGRLSLINFESVELYDKINLATSGVRYALNSTIDLVNVVVFHSIFFISICVYLFTVQPVLTIVCFFCFVPQIFSQLYKSKKYYELNEKTITTSRERDYYKSCLIDKEFYKETKTLNAKKYFLQHYTEKNKVFNSLSWQTEISVAKKDTLLTFVTFLGYVCSFILLSYYLVQGQISLGMFAGIYYSLNKLMGYIKSMVEIYGSIYQNASLAGKLYDFLELPEVEGDDIEIASNGDIKLNNVTFIYPHRETPAVDRISLHIKNGEHVAIVGLNGSGKTTLVKLIAGLFTPTEGDVTHNDINISNVHPTNVYRNISAVFQRFGKYKVSLRENLSLSDFLLPYSDEYSKQRLEQAGFDYKKEDIHENMDIMLSREFNGIDLSGGEWQRLAIARGLYRRSSIIILDEPTASIDPIEEAHVYQRFKDISVDKTSLIVTHRLGSIRNADRILVMKEGRIVEDGSHEELMQSGGLYYEMFCSQAQWYS